LDEKHNDNHHHRRKSKDVINCTQQEWEHAKWVWKVSVATTVTVIDHLVWTHFIEANSFVIVTRETLSIDHPLRYFLKPFTFRIIAINYKASTNLVAERGPVHRAWGFPYDELTRVLQYSQKAYKYDKISNKIDPKMKQLLNDNEYPFIYDVERYFNIINTLVNSYFNIFYPINEPDIFENDEEIRTFYQHICIRLGINHIYTREKLIEIMVNLIIAVTGFHEHVGVVIDYLLQVDFMGTKLYKNATCANMQSYAQSLGVAILTGLRQPMLLEVDYSQFYSDWKNDTKHKYYNCYKPVVQLFDSFKQSCYNLSDEINNNNKTRIQAMNSFNPRNLETSVSI